MFQKVLAYPTLALLVFHVRLHAKTIALYNKNGLQNKENKGLRRIAVGMSAIFLVCIIFNGANRRDNFFTRTNQKEDLELQINDTSSKDNDSFLDRDNDAISGAAPPSSVDQLSILTCVGGGTRCTL